MKIDLTKLTKKELATFERLVRLGDSEQLAFDTVVTLVRADNANYEASKDTWELYVK